MRGGSHNHKLLYCLVKVVAKRTRSTLDTVKVVKIAWNNSTLCAVKVVNITCHNATCVW